MATPTNGRFTAGNQAAVGHSSRSQKLRAAMLNAITETDLQVVTARLIDMAREGSIPAMKLLYDLIGKPTATEAMNGEPINRDRIQQIAESIRTRREAEASEQPAA